MANSITLSSTVSLVTDATTLTLRRDNVTKDASAGYECGEVLMELSETDRLIGQDLVFISLVSDHPVQIKLNDPTTTPYECTMFTFTSDSPFTIYVTNPSATSRPIVKYVTVLGA